VTAGATRQLVGIGVSPGIASGPIAKLAPPPSLPANPGPVADTAAELAAAHEALEAVAADLEARSRQAAASAAGVLGALVMMVRDPALADKIEVLVMDRTPAPHAVAEAFDTFREQLAAAGPYLAERAADLDDLRDRTLAILLGVPMPGVPNPGHPFVLVANDLAPADTATLDTTQVLAIVTEHGGPTSHTAIISKSLGLPAVVACSGVTALADGETVLVDGSEGTVVTNPDVGLVAKSLSRLAAQRAALTEVSGPGRTADGEPVQLLVNVGGEKDLTSAATVDSEGVGLFRTEFLFLDRKDAPTVEEQRVAYAEVFDAFTGRKVVVRTLDAGADKPLRFVTQPDEPNPALGVRGLRTSRRFPEVLDQQLRAIARAAATSGADVWVMAPMVSTPAEATAFCSQAHAHGLPVAGAMVEVPAAALRARAVAAATDFVSLGTNDLAQYTFAADRMAGDLADLLDPWQPALLELVRLTAEAGRAAGKPVGVCGEAASDAALALVLVGLGVTSLSMAPVSLPAVRATLARHSAVECRNLAVIALQAADGRSARAAVRRASKMP
jgi:phosphoenolpyruvate-protein phosphotransferase (PTS system enzyme I)